MRFSEYQWLLRCFRRSGRRWRAVSSSPVLRPRPVRIGRRGGVGCVSPAVHWRSIDFSRLVLGPVEDPLALNGSDARGQPLIPVCRSASGVLRQASGVVQAGSVHEATDGDPLHHPGPSRREYPEGGYRRLGEARRAALGLATNRVCVDHVLTGTKNDRTHRGHASTPAGRSSTATQMRALCTSVLAVSSRSALQVISVSDPSVTE